MTEMGNEPLTVGALKKYIADNDIPDDWLVGVVAPGSRLDDVSTGVSHWAGPMPGGGVFPGGYLEIEVVDD